MWDGFGSGYETWMERDPAGGWLVKEVGGGWSDRRHHRFWIIALLDWATT